MGNYKAAVLASSYTVFLGRVSFGPRTILFGYACLVVLLIVLQRLRQKGRAPLWLIPPLFCLWVNTHGSWFIGMIIFSMIVAGGMVRLKWGMIDSEPWSSSQRKSVLLAWSASVAALFANPFGARLVFYPLDLAFRQKLNSEHIEEWVSVNFHDAGSSSLSSLSFCWSVLSYALAGGRCGTSGDPVCPLQRPDLRSIPVSTRDRHCAGPRENPDFVPPYRRDSTPRDQYFRHTSDDCGHRVLLAPSRACNVRWTTNTQSRRSPTSRPTSRGPS